VSHPAGLRYDTEFLSRLPSPLQSLDQLRIVIRAKHYSIRTEEAYVQWAKRFILFHHKRHPKDMREAEVGQFLNHLAVHGKVSSSTHNQALSALVFLYKEVLGLELGTIDQLERPKRPKRLPVVLTRDEVRRILAQMRGMKPGRPSCSPHTRMRRFFAASPGPGRSSPRGCWRRSVPTAPATRAPWRFSNTAASHR
jgi:integrase